RPTAGSCRSATAARWCSCSSARSAAPSRCAVSAPPTRSKERRSRCAPEVARERSSPTWSSWARKRGDVMPDPDHVAIANLVYRYAELIDAGDFDAVGELFADATISAVGSDVQWRGEQEIREMYVNSTRRYDDGTPRT